MQTCRWVAPSQVNHSIGNVNQHRRQNIRHNTIADGAFLPQHPHCQSTSRVEGRSIGHPNIPPYTLNFSKDRPELVAEPPYKSSVHPELVEGPSKAHQKAVDVPKTRLPSRGQKPTTASLKYPAASIPPDSFTDRPERPTIATVSPGAAGSSGPEIPPVEPCATPSGCRRSRLRLPV